MKTILKYYTRKDDIGAVTTKAGQKGSHPMGVDLVMGKFEQHEQDFNYSDESEEESPAKRARTGELTNLQCIQASTSK